MTNTISELSYKILRKYIKKEPETKAKAATASMKGDKDSEEKYSKRLSKILDAKNKLQS